MCSWTNPRVDGLSCIRENRRPAIWTPCFLSEAKQGFETARAGESEMANMSYCRFENTFRDLEDCHEHVDDDLDGSELCYRTKLIELCRLIVDDYDGIQKANQED